MRQVIDSELHKCVADVRSMDIDLPVLLLAVVGLALAQYVAAAAACGLDCLPPHRCSIADAAAPEVG